MNENLKSFLRRTGISIVAAVLLRALCVLLFTLMLSKTDDPLSGVSLFTVLARVLSDFLTGIIFAHIPDRSFSHTTKVLTAMSLSLLISLAEISAGRLIFERNGVNVPLLLISLISSGAGAFLLGSRGKSRKKAKRRRRRA